MLNDFDASWSGMYHPRKVHSHYEKTTPVIPTMFICGEHDPFCTEPGEDPDLPFRLIPELKADIMEKMARCGLDPKRMQTWKTDPITWYCYPDTQGVPMLTVGIVRDMAHANFPEESWISWDALSQFSAESGCFPSMQLDELELKWFYLFHYLINGCIDKNSHSLALLRKIIGYIFHEAWRFRKEDKPHPIGTCCFNGANVFGFAHTTHFDNHIPSMNSLRASPGLGVFINVSPMRKPRKPAWRSSLTVSGLLIPLSETRR